MAVGTAVLAFVRSYTGYLAETYASVGSTNLVDSASRKVWHPQGGNVPSLKHMSKNATEDAQPSSFYLIITFYKKHTAKGRLNIYTAHIYIGGVGRGRGTIPFAPKKIQNNQKHCGKVPWGPHLCEEQQCSYVQSILAQTSDKASPQLR